MYHVSFDECARRSLSEAADLAALLPMGSLTMGALEPSASWSEDRYMLARMANDMAVVAWNAKGRPGDMPIPFKGPARSEVDADEIVGMESDELFRALARARQ